MVSRSHFGHWLLTVSAPSGVRRWWSGSGDLDFGGSVYEGTLSPDGPVMAIDAAETQLGGGARRAQVSVSVATEAIRRMLAVDIGAVDCEIRWISSVDGGQNYTALPETFVGSLSAPVIRSGIYSFEVETVLGDSQRGEVRRWSHEAQSILFPGDLGFEFAAQIDAGLEIQWW